MQNPLDETTIPWTKYGIEGAAAPAIAGFRAVSLINLAILGSSAQYDALATHLQACARSPDIYALVLRSSAADGPPRVSETTPLPSAELMAELAIKLALYWRIDCFPKPSVALLDGPLSPSDIGLTTFTTHRVAGESYCLALPTPALKALPPAAGIAQALARLPHARGLELVLTGRSIERAEAYALGLVTHCIPSAAFPEIVAALADGQPVDPLLDALHQAPPQPPAAHPHSADAAVADGQTDAASIENAVASLVQRASRLSVRDSLILTYRLAANLLAADSGASASIDDMFLPPQTGDLYLPTGVESDTGRF